MRPLLRRLAPPEYVARHPLADPTLPPPFVVEESTLTILPFGTQDEGVQLRKMVDNDLNKVAAGAVRYEPLSDWAVLVLADQYGRTDDPTEVPIPEQEVAIWIPVVDERQCIMWYLPFVYTFPFEAVVTGREVYGYPKYLADISITTTDCDVSIHNPNVRKGSPTAQIPILSIAWTRSSGRQKLDPEEYRRRWTSRNEDGNESFRRTLKLRSPYDPDRIPPARAPRQPRPRTLAGRIARNDAGWTQGESPRDIFAWCMAINPRMVFLKQFRDSNCKSRAVYQALVEASFELDLFDTFDMGEIARADVEANRFLHGDIAAALGTRPDLPEILDGRYFEGANFKVNAGREIWWV